MLFVRAVGNAYGGIGFACIGKELLKIYSIYLASLRLSAPLSVGGHTSDVNPMGITKYDQNSIVERHGQELQSNGISTQHYELYGYYLKGLWPLGRMHQPSILDGTSNKSTAVLMHQKKRRAEQWRSNCHKCLNGLLNFGSPILNKTFTGFVNVGAIGALHATTQDMYNSWLQGLNQNMKHLSVEMLRFEFAEQEIALGKSWNLMAARAGKEAFRWGFVGGLYSGMTYGMQEVRGVHDWKNVLVGGALTGAAVSLAQGKSSMDVFVQGAITGGALAVANQILSGMPLQRR